MVCARERRWAPGRGLMGGRASGRGSLGPCGRLGLRAGDGGCMSDAPEVDQRAQRAQRKDSSRGAAVVGPVGGAARGPPSSWAYLLGDVLDAVVLVLLLLLGLLGFELLPARAAVART